jgi:L-asparagine transporter-like permease
MSIKDVLIAYAIIGFVVFLVTKDMGLAFKWPYLVAKSIFMFVSGFRNKT